MDIVWACTPFKLHHLGFVGFFGITVVNITIGLRAEDAENDGWILD